MQVVHCGGCGLRVHLPKGSTSTVCPRCQAPVGTEASPAPAPERSRPAGKEAARRRGEAPAAPGPEQPVAARGRRRGGAQPAPDPEKPATARGRGRGEAADATGPKRRRTGSPGHQSRVARPAGGGMPRAWMFGIGAGVVLLGAVVAGLVAAFTGDETEVVASADPPPVAPPADPAAPDDPGDAAVPSGKLTVGPRTEAFFERLGSTIPGVGEIGGSVYWTGRGETRFAIAGTRLGNPVFGTAIGYVEIDRSLAEWAPAEMGPELLALVETAKKAGAGAKEGGKDSGYVLEHDPLFGFHLSSNESMIVVEGVASREALADRRVEDHMATLREAVARFRTELEASGLGSIARTALLDVVELLDERDGDEDVDEIPPSFARKLVRRGWLTSLAGVGRLASARAVETAAIEMMKLQPTVAYRGEGLQLVKSQDALGHRSWFLSTPRRAGYAVRVHLPHYHPAARKELEANGRLVVILPPGLDPRTDDTVGEKAVEARLYHGRDVLARWHRDEGFRADLAAWRKVAPTRDDRGTVRDFLPPHIVLTDLQNDPRLLLTARGVVVPVRDPSPGEAERFLAEAARVLSDPAHLDLLGEHLFKYVYDSPDTTIPTLVGTKTHNGEIHQTAEQSMATAVGGVCRGDCDDLSEVYVNVLRRQGKLAHVIGLPGHAAAAYCEKGPDGWHAYVLQTGPAFEAVDATLDGALKKLHDLFRAGDQFDANAVVVLLRFPGENTRKSFSLGYRIFEDPDYAALMIDIQEDWHNGTYFQAISKVEALVAGGDEQAATFKELNGLYDTIGDRAKALEYELKAYEKTPEGVARIQRAIDLVGQYVANDKEDEARELSRRILEEMVPKLGRSMGPTLSLRIALALYDQLSGPVPDLALDLMRTRIAPAMDRLLSAASAQASSGRIGREEWGQVAESRLLAEYADSILDLAGRLEAASAEGNRAAVDGMLEGIRPYYDSLLFLEASGPQDVMRPYSTVAEYYARLRGEAVIEAMVEKAPLPTGPTDHWRRASGESQLQRDLPWIRVSVWYWARRLTDEINAATRGSIDRERVRKLHQRTREALEAGRRLDVLDAQAEYMSHIADFLAAFALEDEAGLRKHLQHVKRQNDRQLRESTATYLGSMAGITTPEWFERAIAMWREEIDYKPTYFQIAWGAARAKANAQALHVARVAAERYKDDPAFPAEYEAMKKRLGG